MIWFNIADPKATHCNETDCFWSSANLTELGLFDDLASIIANISKNGNDADALELELRNSELEQDEPPVTDDDESFGVIWPDPIFFGSLQKKSNFREYFDDDDDDENDDDNDDFDEIEDEYDFESRNLLPPDVVSQNQNPNPVIELDEMSPEFPADLPPIDNQLEINPPNPNTSQVTKLLIFPGIDEGCVRDYAILIVFFSFSRNEAILLAQVSNIHRVDCNDEELFKWNQNASVVFLCTQT